VLEAPLGSGAIITADLALDYGRDVFAVPGPIFTPSYAGCHTLIATGQARLVTCAEEVLCELGTTSSPEADPAPQEPIYTPKTQAEEVVYSLLSLMPVSVDELMQKTQLPPSVMAGTLTMLELEGVVQRLEGNLWVKN
jgi:DNA processing protein